MCKRQTTWAQSNYFTNAVKINNMSFVMGKILELAC